MLRTHCLLLGALALGAATHAGAEPIFEVLAIDVSGNQTITEGDFEL